MGGGARSVLFRVEMSGRCARRNPIVMTNLYRFCICKKVDDSEKILKISGVNISGDKFVNRNVASDNKKGKFEHLISLYKGKIGLKINFGYWVCNSIQSQYQ
jgi:hypothetical protein